MQNALKVAFIGASGILLASCGGKKTSAPIITPPRIVVPSAPAFQMGDMTIPQGDYSMMAANREAFAQELAKYDLVIVTHGPINLVDAVPVATVGESFDPAEIATYDGCHGNAGTFGAENWAWSMARSKEINPLQTRAIYLVPTLDAPRASRCGYDLFGAENAWSTTELVNYRHMAEAYVFQYGDLFEMFFNDIIAPFSNGGWVDANTRDLAYAINRELGKGTVANATYPSFINVNFAGEGLGPEDFVLVEGFYRFGGADSAAASQQMIDNLQGNHGLACLVSSGPNEDPTTQDMDGGIQMLSQVTDRQTHIAGMRRTLDRFGFEDGTVHALS